MYGVAPVTALKPNLGAMASVVVGRGRPGWARWRGHGRGGAAVGVFVLLASSFALRTRGLAATHLWMDEGIAVGIAAHPLARIPGLLRLDGSPPLYYLLLHGWMGIAGASDVAVHWLSVLLALLCVPTALWSGTCVGGRGTGWVLAVLVACCPFVTSQARDARMYVLVVLLGLVCVGCFVNAYVHGRRTYRVPFGFALALLLYAHNWALFLTVALVLALAVVVRAAPADRRARVLRDAIPGFGIAAVLYAPWLPTLFFQSEHTGAPWATVPSAAELVRAPEAVLGGEPAALVALLAAAGAPLVLARGAGSDRALGPVLGVLAVVPVVLGWSLSQASPVWDARYLAVIVAPVLMLAAVALAYGRRVGIAALAVLVALWVPAGAPVERSDAFELARDARPLLCRGDLVLATAFADVPLLAHYLPPGMRYASPFGRVPDAGVVDWRDAARRLASTPTRTRLLALLDRVRVGSHVLLVTRAAWDARSRQTALGREERRRAGQSERELLHDARFVAVARLPNRVPRLPQTAILRGLLLRKQSADAAATGDHISVQP